MSLSDESADNGRSEKISEFSHVHRQDSSCRSNSGDHHCRVFNACWAHMFLIRLIVGESDNVLIRAGMLREGARQRSLLCCIFSPNGTFLAAER
jgi:hypothetical protein